MTGATLIRTLIQASGLPPESLSRELDRLIRERGLSENELTLDHVREILATYLQDTLIEAKANWPAPLHLKPPP